MTCPLIRPATLGDLDALFSFSELVGLGFTSLPHNREVLEGKIRHSIESFGASIVKPHNENYIFILEVDGIAVGCSAIVSKIGMEEPFYAFHLRKERQDSRVLEIGREIPVLYFIEAIKKPTEISTLFLKKEYRHKEFGVLLSFSRFLFMASKRTRFAPRVIGELRGFVDSRGKSPFWEAIGSRFYNMSYEQAVNLRVKHPEIISEIFPKHPIYPWLLPQEASSAIGEVHPDTIGAKKLLEKLGFVITSYFDIFDAGPHLYCPTEDILAVKGSKESVVTEIHASELPSKPKGILSNTLLDFRATMAPVVLDEQGGVILSKSLSEALLLQEGDKIRYFFPS